MSGGERDEFCPACEKLGWQETRTGVELHGAVTYTSHFKRCGWCGEEWVPDEFARRNEEALRIAKRPGYR
jgi:hypothetical protein